MQNPRGTFVRTTSTKYLPLTSVLFQNLLAHASAAAFLLRIISPPSIARCLDAAAAVQAHRDTLPDGTPVSVYRRRRGSRGALFLLHGLSGSGAGDPRIVELASALALTGLTVVVPHVRELMELEVRPAVVGRVAGMIVMTAARRDWCGEGRIHLCGPCISAGVLLLAAEKICAGGAGGGGGNGSGLGAVLLVGPYASVGSVHEWVFCNPEADSYGRNAILLNSIRMLAPESLIRSVWDSGRPALKDVSVEEVCLLLKGRLDDDHFGPLDGDRCGNRVRATLPSVSPGSAAVFNALTTSARALAAISCDIVQHAEVRAYADLLSPTRHLKSLRSPNVVIIHGASDSVVPSRETPQLAEHVARACPLVDAISFDVTPLLGHGERVDEPGGLASLRAYVVAVVYLVAAFGKFFLSCLRESS
jgi:hypothetical protein